MNELKSFIKNELKRCRPIFEAADIIEQIESLNSQHQSAVEQTKLAKAEAEKLGKANDKAKAILADAESKAASIVQGAEEAANALIQAANDEAAIARSDGVDKLAAIASKIAAQDASLVDAKKKADDAKAELAAIDKALAGAKAKLKGLIDG